jgi:TRAP-type C4-dicarboxylate transport system substrate-binding protein
VRATVAGRFHYRLGLNQPEASPTARRLAEMAAAIGRETDGALRIEVFPEGRLGLDPEMLAELRAGRLEFYLSGALLGALAPSSALPMMPFAFRDSQAVFAALDGLSATASAASWRSTGSTRSAARCKTGFII